MNSQTSLIRSNQGFSVVIALLLTGFLITLAAGVLFLFLSENRINQSLFNGTAAYHAAEGGLEYALLKAKNHREGFADSMTMDSSVLASVEGNEGNRIGEGLGPRAPKIGYEITANAQSYTGVIRPDSFEIIPLFYEKGTTLRLQSGGKPWKDPRNPNNTESPPHAFDSLQNAADFALEIQTGERLVWNVIGNNSSGDTFGISGIVLHEPNAELQKRRDVSVLKIGTNGMSLNTLGNFRTYADGLLQQGTKSISNFLSSYEQNYLVLYNPGTQAVSYFIRSPQIFSLPATRIVASGRVRDSLINLELKQDKSALFEILKYSLFVKE